MNNLQTNAEQFIKVSNDISSSLGWHVDYQMAALDSAKLVYLYNLLCQKNLGREDVYIIKHYQIGPVFVKIPIESDSIENETIDVISSFMNTMRERSHGAVTAYKVYLGKSVLPTEEGKEYKIRGVQLIKCEHLEENCIVVLGRPKFELVSPDLLIIRGYLDLEKNG